MKHNIVFIDMNRIFGIPIRWGIPDNTKSSIVIDNLYMLRHSFCPFLLQTHFVESASRDDDSASKLIIR